MIGHGCESTTDCTDDSKVKKHTGRPQPTLQGPGGMLPQKMFGIFDHTSWDLRPFSTEFAVCITWNCIFLSGSINVCLRVVCTHHNTHSTLSCIVSHKIKSLGKASMCTIYILPQMTSLRMLCLDIQGHIILLLQLQCPLI